MKWIFTSSAVLVSCRTTTPRFQIIRHRSWRRKVTNAKATRPKPSTANSLQKKTFRKVAMIPKTMRLSPTTQTRCNSKCCPSVIATTTNVWAHSKSLIYNR